jgi:hypothetical protein
MLALGFGPTAGMVWELGGTPPSSRPPTPNTLGDLTLGSLGALVAGVVIHQAKRIRPAPAQADRS